RLPTPEPPPVLSRLRGGHVRSFDRAHLVGRLWARGACHAGRVCPPSGHLFSNALSNSRIPSTVGLMPKRFGDHAVYASPAPQARKGWSVLTRDCMSVMAFRFAVSSGAVSTLSSNPSISGDL